VGSASGGTAPVRLDVWLWAARFHRTRSLAKQAIEAGHVAINGAAGKPAKAVPSVTESR
jgi:ribosome-associated heat shock protein Hsp15